MDDNRRRRSRVHTEIPATYIQNGSTAFPLTTRNISLKGMLTLPQAEILTGENGVVRIELSSEAVIELECTIIRSDAEGIAIDFLNMDELSFMHLRNLVRYNAPDADQIDAELSIPAFND